VLWIRIGFDAAPDPDPAFYLNADPDPGSQTNASMRIRIQIQDSQIKANPDPQHCLMSYKTTENLRNLIINKEGI
jgi:hypothetical protein